MQSHRELPRHLPELLQTLGIQSFFPSKPKALEGLGQTRFYTFPTSSTQARNFRIQVDSEPELEIWAQQGRSSRAELGAGWAGSTGREGGPTKKH